MRCLIRSFLGGVCALCVVFSVFGQEDARTLVVLEGIITDITQHTPVEFATIRLEPIGESGALSVRGDVADRKGGYRFSDLPLGRYVLTVSSVGYLSQSDTLILSTPLTKRNYKLSPSVTDLQSVTIAAKGRRAEIDNRTFTFDRADVKRATYARDLLLHLPNLVHDPVGDKLQLAEGGSLLILINGVRATEGHLRTIPPSKVRRVVYYDVPPARYAGFGAVVDVITSELTTGIVAGGQLMHAFTTGFANDRLYGAVTYGRHRFDADYSLSWRNYRDRRYSEHYRYNLLGTDREEHAEMRDAFGYASHDIDLRYSYSGENNRVFQFVFQPNYMKYWADAGGDGFYHDGVQRTNRHEDSRSRESNFSPSLDFYYSQSLFGGELSTNLRGTLFDVSKYNYMLQTDQEGGAPLVEDNMHLESKKQTLIGEVDYSHRLGRLGSLSGGYRGEYSWLASDMDNLFGRNHYGSTYAKNYLYTELTGGRGAWSYRLSLALTHLAHHSPRQSYARTLFTPQAMLGYRFNKAHQIRLEYYSSPLVPSVTQLSDNVSRLAPDIISVGNPLLQNGMQHAISLRYSWRHKYFDLSINPNIIKGYRPIVQSFYLRQGFYALGYENGVQSSAYQLATFLTVKPLGTNAIVLRGVFAPVYNEVQTLSERYSVVGYRNRLSLMLNYKAWTLNYAVRIPVYHLSDGFLELEENMHNLFGSYKWKQWVFSAGVLFIGSPSHYERRSLPESQVRYSSSTDIYDNRNMLVLGVQYHFDSGKNREIQRKLNNTDTSGVPSF